MTAGEPAEEMGGGGLGAVRKVIERSSSAGRGRGRGRGKSVTGKAKPGKDSAGENMSKCDMLNMGKSVTGKHKPGKDSARESMGVTC